MSADKTKLYPAWRQAEADLLASGITHGSLISDDWLREAFGLPAVEHERTIAEHEKNVLVFLRQFQNLRESLLENHRLMLRPVKGVGYTVVPPESQTRVAMSDRTKEVRAALAKLEREISYVALERLSDEQRKENSDAVAKLGSLRTLMRKQLKER